MEKVINKINEIITNIQTESKNRRYANHLYHLKKRLIAGKKLTKKMQENLAWIKDEVS